jgi:two-component system nitrate/nitrite response regulator NarL
MANARNGVSSVNGAAAGSRSGEPVPLRVFVLSDMRLLCEGLGLALARETEVELIGAGDSSLPLTVVAHRPDVLLLDVSMPSWAEKAAAVRMLLPVLKIVAIAVAEVEQEVFACAAAGVSGFVSRDGTINDVVTAIHCAVRDELVCSRRTAALLLGRVTALSSRRPEPADGLTRREHEIVALLGEGMSNKEIARALRIQNATVKNHIHTILGKLRVRRRGEIAANFHRGGLPDPRLHAPRRPAQGQQ